MKLNYTYQPNPNIDDLITKIKINQKVITKLPQAKNISNQIRSQHILKSSLYSAQIEGNPLSLDQVSFQQIEQNKISRHKLEVQNLFKAYEYIFSHTNQKIDFELIKHLHQLSMDELIPTGKFRSEQTAIYNQAGVAVYITPPPNQIKTLVKQLIDDFSTNRIIDHIILHFGFEKIHPFLDGNGRVGRLLLTHGLNQTSFNFNGMLVLENFLIDNRPTYYSLLNQSGKDLTDWITFFLEGIHHQSEALLETIESLGTDSDRELLSLLPRRQEIVRIIRDHHQVSFDFLHRRFLQVPNSTLHHDLKVLTQKGFIRKLGSTRGALYQAE